MRFVQFWIQDVKNASDFLFNMTFNEEIFIFKNVKPLLKKNSKRLNFFYKKVFITILPIYYLLSLLTNTLKFESTFLILFFLLFVNLLYSNAYHYIVTELDKYTFNQYLTYKETVRRRINRIRSNVSFFKLRKNKLKSIVKRASKTIAVTYVKNYTHFKFSADFSMIFFVNSFLVNLTVSQLQLKKI